MAHTFTTDIVSRAIKSCRNIKAFGPDKFSIFHLKHLGPRAIESPPSSTSQPRLVRFNDTSVGTSYRPIREYTADSQIPLVQCPTILGVYNKHIGYVAERVSSRNNILKALAGTSWGQQETLLMTYKAVGRSIINYAAPVWSTNLRDTNYRNIQYTQNEALRIATGCHKMSSVDHLHVKAKMLKVREHSELLSAHLTRKECANLAQLRSEYCK